MKINNLHNIVVYIKDEAMLQEAREILERYGEMTDTYMFNLYKNNRLNYMQFYDYWFLSSMHVTDTEITLTELEQLLKQNRDETTQRT